MKNFRLLTVLIFLALISCKKEEQPAPVEPKPKELTSQTILPLAGFLSSQLQYGLDGDQVYDAGNSVCIISSKNIQWINKESLAAEKSLDFGHQSLHTYSGKQDTIVYAESTFYRIKPVEHKLEKIGESEGYAADFSVIDGKGIIYYVGYGDTDEHNHLIKYLDFNGTHNTSLYQLNELKNDSLTLMELEAYEKNNEIYLIYNYSQAFQLSKMKVVNLNTGATVYETYFPQNTSIKLLPALKPDLIRTLTINSPAGKKFAVTDVRNSLDINEWNYETEVTYDLNENNLFLYVPGAAQARLYSWNSYQPELEFKVPIKQSFHVAVNLFKDWLGMTTPNDGEIYLIDHTGKARFKLKEAGYQLLYADKKIAITRTESEQMKIFRLD